MEKIQHLKTFTGCPRPFSFVAHHLMHNMGKRPSCHMQTAKVWMRIHICVVWSGHSLFANIYYTIHWFCKRATKALVRRQFACNHTNVKTNFLGKIRKKYSRLSLSRIPRDSVKYFEISIPRHIRFAELRKQSIDQPYLTNVYVIWLLKLDVYWKYCGKEEKLLLRSNFSYFPQYFVTCF